MIQPLNNIPIASYTYYNIGGPARELYFPHDAAELSEALERINNQNIPWYLLGGGSNVLVGDGFWDGAVIITTEMNGYEVFGDRITCGAGLESSKVSEIAFENDKTGLEFLYQLPGSIGGALAMNARYDMRSLSDAFESLVAVHPTDGMKTFGKNDVEFKYKQNSLISGGWILCDITLLWSDGISSEIRLHMDAIEEKRAIDHHFDSPSCGCIFKNDHERNIQAGKLLDELGFKGFGIGGAQVSEHHANFIINKGNATASDVLSIIEHIEGVVKEKKGIDLKREVRLVGAF